MSTVTTERKQATIPNQVSEELVEQVIYIFQNHLAPMVETAIKDRVEKYERPKPSINTDALLTRNEFLTAMQLMEKRFEEQKEYTEKLFQEQKENTVKLFEAMNKRFEDVNKRFDDVNKRFNFMQWLIGIGFVVIPLIGTFLQNILN